MFDVLLEAALRATFMAAAALAALWLLRVRAASVRHRVWTVVMLAMLALPLAIAFAPAVSLQVLPPTYSEAPIAVAPVAEPPPPAIARFETAAVELTPAPSWDWRAWLIAVYLAGVATLLARLAIGTVRVHLLARDAAVVNGWLTSDRIATPFTFGWLNPTVLLPAGWDRWPAERLAVVLDHERSHLLRRDPLVQWLALLNRAVFWFHPLAWWLERHLAAVAEEACDAAVLARGHDAADYSQQLLDLARIVARKPTPHLLGMPMAGGALAKRIETILDGDFGRPASRAAAAGAAALATLGAVVLATVTLAQETARPRSLVEVYELALVNDPVVRQAEAEYRAVAAAQPRTPDVARATADRDAAQQELLLRVARPYFGVAAAKRELTLRESALEPVSRQLEQTQRRFEVGLVPITDVQEIQASYDEAVARELTARSQLATAEQELRSVVGELVGELKPLGENLPLSAPTPPDVEQWVATALQQNPVMVSSRLRAESAGGDADAQRAARAALERAAVQTEQATRSAYVGTIAEISRVRALEQSVRSNETMLKATEAGFEAGIRSTSDVLAAERTLRASETAYAVSYYDYALNMLRLQRAAGALTDRTLAEVNRWFE